MKRTLTNMARVGLHWKFRAKSLWIHCTETTWEPEENIPLVFRNFFNKTGKENIPQPQIKHTKKVGSKIYHLLSWDTGDRYWEEDNAFSLEGCSLESQTLTEFQCQTRKVVLKIIWNKIWTFLHQDKDKRLCRHTWGVLIGCFPCGVVVLFDEIFGSGYTYYNLKQN